MTSARSQRAELKQACLGLLDARAIEHPAGHQAKLSARYMLHRADGAVVELMFEKHPDYPANLWLAEHHGARSMDRESDYRVSPASDLLSPGTDGGQPRYGRHSGLKPMRQLAYEDLICITIRTVAELEALLDGILAGR